MLETISQKSLNLLKKLLLVSFKVILTALACYAGYYVLFIYISPFFSDCINNNMLLSNTLISLFILTHLIVPGLIYILIFSRKKLALESIFVNISFCSLNFFDSYFTFDHFLSFSILNIIFTSLFLFIQYLIIKKKYILASFIFILTSILLYLFLYLFLYFINSE